MITFSVPSLLLGTSDTFPAILSEVPLFCLAPPTLFPHFRRRSPACKRTKPPARTLWVSFALEALSRRPCFWPAMVRRKTI